VFFFSFIAKHIFSASPLLIYLLDLLRVPLKNSFNAFFSYFVDDRVDEVLADEENIIDVIHALRGIDSHLNQRFVFYSMIHLFRYNLSE